jgi:uncharacterized protein (TIGR03790 family)
MTLLIKFIWRVAVLLAVLCYPSQASAIVVELPRSGIRADELAIIVNQRDPLSRQIAHYYQQRRHIPEANIIRVAFTPGKRVLSRGEFEQIKRQVDAATGAHIQAYALAWTAPYRVDCMSISSAFALGFDQAWCAQGCKMTRQSEYYNAATTRPWSDTGVRPTMMLAARDLSEAKKLIDRGQRADARMPRGNIYLVETSDRNRSVRASVFPMVERAFGSTLPVHWERAESIKNKSNILFYFTGLTHVPDIGSNHYLPGAMADHLTSSGGVLTGGSQMSALRWLEAGATGSYGAVVEPCNFIAKFPNPAVAIYHYLRGNTLIEAYWKSVAMPGQGVFIGEPLAQPFRGYTLRKLKGSWILNSPILSLGTYRVLAADHPDDPLETIYDVVPVLPMQPGIILGEPLRTRYRIEALD